MLPRALLCALLAAFVLGACTPAPEAESDAASTAADERAAQDLHLYEEMRARGSHELAAPIGEGVLKRAPDTAAAAQIRETIEATREKAHAINEARRLAALWLYQTSPMSGGVQTTAVIHPSQPARYSRRVRLILRKHTEWGRSVYLYDTADKGFTCAGSCRLLLTVDGAAAAPLHASRPDSGEPALFIDSETRLLELLASAGKLGITVELQGEGPRELLFEVGGFDAARWPEPDAAAPEGSVQ